MKNIKAKVFNDENPVASYSSLNCHEAAINHLIEEGACSDEVEALHHEDFNWRFEDYSEMYWFDMEEAVKALCDKYFKNGAGLICPAFGWAKRVGASEFEDNAFQAFKEAYLDTEFTIKVYLKRNSELGIHLEIVISHHDSPMGDYMFLVRKKYHAQFIQNYFGVKKAA